MSDLVPKEYLRLFKCLLDTAAGIVCAFTHDKLLSSYEGSFQKYLEDKKHFFFHQWQGTQSPCCDCSSDGCTFQMICAMESWMFKILFMETTMGKTSHILKHGEGKQQKCIHKYAALNIKIDNLDICPLNYILRTTCILSTQEQAALELIEEKRNTLCQAWSAKCLSTAQLSNIWNDLERSILCLTNPYLVKIITDQITVIKSCDITMEEITEFTQKISRMNKVLEYRESSSGNDYDNVMVMDHTIGKISDRNDPAVEEVDKTVKIETLEIPAPVKGDKKKCEENRESSSCNRYDNVTEWTKHIGEIADRDDPALKEVNKPVTKALHGILTIVNKDQKNRESSSCNKYDNVTEWTKHIGEIADRGDPTLKEVNKPVTKAPHGILTIVNKDQSKCEEYIELSPGHKYDNVTDWTKHIGEISDRDDTALREVDKTGNIGAHGKRKTVSEQQRKFDEVRHLIEDSIAELFESSVPRKDVGLHPERVFNREYFSRKTMTMRNKRLVIMKPVISFDI
ncbi:uncharacterized protein LOC143054567 isoform X3 [Mytilus galloprovincialis]|uniref:uncharacterized protein LOC143054567 isoform X3 n=1 Tax=Mytilus galloprovincialis TaxID=29158 RepID=UPI003F7BEF75